jgi:hypothetical protein
MTEALMDRNPATTERLRQLIIKLDAQTASGQLHWERQAGSAHRYARFNNNLLILGPAAPLSKKKVPRYLFITPFDSPDCIEVNSDDAELGSALIQLVQTVEQAGQHQPATDPFAITEQLLERIESS